MTGYRWLLLKEGTLAIGTKDDRMGRLSWSALMPDGTHRAVSDHELIDTKSIKKPRVALQQVTTVVGEIQ